MIATVEVLLLLAIASAPHPSLDKASQALADFRPDDAVDLLTRAKEEEGPYTHEDHVRLYEQLGIAYAYLERGEEAKHAFDVMLALEPNAAISYTLSPKVTFLFEQARATANARPTPAIDLSWSRDLHRAGSHSDRRRGGRRSPSLPEEGLRPLPHQGHADWQEQRLDLPPEGRVARIELPPAAPSAEQTESVEIYAIAYDAKDDEVLLWGSERRPREIGLRFEAPERWYGQWWVWVAAGAVVAAGAGAAVFAVTREPGATVPGKFQVP